MAEPSANAELGDPAYGSDTKAVTYEAGEALTAGDVVAIASGEAVAAEDTTNTNALGVAGEDATDGDNMTVYTEGPVVANVATGVSAGEALTVSGTDGQLAAGAGDFDALTDEGAVAGLSAGYGLADNAAVVNF
jgi:hypothetical protein